MKIITKILTLILTIACVGAQPVSVASAPKAPPDHKKMKGKGEELFPAVKQFIVLCLNDEKNKYVKVHDLLKTMEVDQPDKDQMTEILSGLVWKIDRDRGRKIAREIKDPKKQRLTLLHYDLLEQTQPPQPPVKKE